MQPEIAKHVCHEARGAEYFCKSRVADAQAPGVGAERRQNRVIAVADKTTPLQRASARSHPRLWMKVSGYLAGRAGRLVAEYDGSDRHLGCNGAAEISPPAAVADASDGSDSSTEELAPAT